MMCKITKHYSFFAGAKVRGAVPGTQYTALLNQGLIEDPLYRDNDVSLQSVGRGDWTYSLNFAGLYII